MSTSELTKEPTTNVTLPDSLLVLLDGQCNSKIQSLVDAAKRRIALASGQPDIDPRISGFVADLVSHAEQEGKLIFRPTRLRLCSVCDMNAGYAKYARNSRYHRKGDANTDKPLTMAGFEFAEAFIRIAGHATLGCCSKCWNVAEELAREALSTIRAELPENLAGTTRYIRHHKRKCKECGWEGHEGQMRQLPALMGYNKYPGGCPSCTAKNEPFGPTLVELVGGFELVEVVTTHEGEET